MKTECKYPSDLTNRQWQLIRQLLPPRPRVGRRPLDRRWVINAILYVVRTGCQWRMLPQDFPNWNTVYGIFWRWRNDGTWERIHDALREKVRRSAGKKSTPTAAVIDSQSIRTAEGGEERSQAAFGCRYPGDDLGRGGPSRGLAGSRRSDFGDEETRPEVWSIEGPLWRQRLWSQRSAELGPEDLRLDPSDRLATGRCLRIRRTAEALDRGTHVRLAGTTPATQQRLRENHRLQRSDDLSRHD